MEALHIIVLLDTTKPDLLALAPVAPTVRLVKAVITEELLTSVLSVISKKARFVLALPPTILKLAEFARAEGRITFAALEATRAVLPATAPPA